MFKRNEGILDRIVRTVLGTVLLPTGLFLLNGLQGSVLGLVVTGFGVFVLTTGLIGFCPVYIPFGISTLEKEKQLMAKCMSMMAGFRQGPTGSGLPSTEQPCGPCLPSNGTTHNQQG